MNIIHSLIIIVSGESNIAKMRMKMVRVYIFGEINIKYSPSINK